MNCRKKSCQYHNDHMTGNCAKGEPPNVEGCMNRKAVTDDIILRLEDMHSKRYNSNWATWVQTQCSEGAKEIRRLRAELSLLTLSAAESQREVERLNDRLAARSLAAQEWASRCGQTQAQLEKVADKLVDAEADRDKYKAALERIASGEVDTAPFPHRNLDRADMKSIAAEAVRHE